MISIFVTNLLIGLAVGTLGLIVRPLLHAIARGVSGNVPAPYDGPSRKAASSEVTRLVSASAILLGSAFRRRVLEHARDTHHACPPELGLDFEPLLRVCRWAEDREIRYDLTITAGALLGLGLFITDHRLLAILTLCVLCTGVFCKRFEERFRLARLFRRAHYDPSVVEQKLWVDLSDTEQTGVPRLDQNVWAYSGFLPFESAGFEVGGWSFVVDASRPKPGCDKSAIEPCETEDIRQAVEDAVAAVRQKGILCRDYLVMHGSNLPNLVPGEGREHWRSMQRVDSARMRSVADGTDDRFRHYKWIQLHDWGDEIVVSSFFLCSRVGDDIYVECRHHLLTALAPRYRKVDVLTNSTWSARHLAAGHAHAWPRLLHSLHDDVVDVVAPMVCIAAVRSG